MLYLVAFFVPPLAILLAGRPFQAFLNLLLVIAGCIGLFVMGLGAILLFGSMVHAFMVVANRNADRRTNRIIAAMQQPRY